MKKKRRGRPTLGSYKLDCTINVKLPAHTLEELNAYAARINRPRGRVIREAIYTLLDLDRWEREGA